VNFAFNWSVFQGGAERDQAESNISRSLKKSFTVFAIGPSLVIASRRRSNLVVDVRDKLRNLGFKEMNNFENATPALKIPGQAQQKALLAMTILEFSSSLLET
jgi:hypothetical protein